VVAALREARGRREGSAARVSRGILSKYERIRGRAHEPSLYPLRGAACGRCNTAIPLQRRNAIAAGRSIEVCEGCGVLLYATV
jgi:predicted  nucleic acid-binding Zn-ribbon protein